MQNRLSISHDERSESAIRKSLVWQWTLAIAFMDWILYFSTDHFHDRSLLAPIAITLGGIAAGWLFGYKLGFAPLFSGVYIFSVTREVEPKK